MLSIGGHAIDEDIVASLDIIELSIIELVQSVLDIIELSIMLEDDCASDGIVAEAMAPAASRMPAIRISFFIFETSVGGSAHRNDRRHHRSRARHIGSRLSTPD